MKPFTFSKEYEYYFCTDTIIGWQYVFTSYPFFNIIVDSLKYCRDEKGLRIHGFVIMPNHIHMLLSAEKNNPGDILRDFKRHTSKKISELLIELNNQRLLKYFATTAGFIGKGNDYKIWQQGSHPEPIFSEKFLLQKLNYVHQNPVRKGFVDKPEYWVFSSARNYSTGDQSILTIDFLP